MEVTVGIKDEALALIEELAELEEQLQKGYVQAARGAKTCCHSRRQARSRSSRSRKGGGTT